MPTIHGTPAGVSCILFSSPGSWDHREGDRQQSDSSSQEPSPQQQAVKRRMWKSIQASDWKWACHHVQFWGPDNWSGTNLNHLLCNCLSVSNSAWKKSSSCEQSSACMRTPNLSWKPPALRTRNARMLLASPKQWKHHWELLQLL